MAVGDVMTGDNNETQDERDRLKQRSRSIAIALALLFLVVLFYVATIVRLGPDVLNRPM
ncbi:MAG: hypothetical protein K0U34_06400 [Alphaproteobacteria bacterium]|nr:hypothetical protein [Alphaproteobacteria bacterium]